jgi:hypothetical protein
MEVESRRVPRRVARRRRRVPRRFARRRVPWRRIKVPWRVARRKVAWKNRKKEKEGAERGKIKQKKCRGTLKGDSVVERQKEEGPWNVER